MATTNWTVRAEDDNTFCKTIDANLVSLQGDTAERNIALEREMAIYERDSVKIGTFLLRLFESQLKIHLRMRVDTPKKWTDFKREVFASSRASSHSSDTADSDGQRIREQRDNEQMRQGS